MLIEWLKKMRRRVLADLAADCGTHNGAVAPVHPAPYARVSFLRVNLVDAGVVPNPPLERDVLYERLQFIDFISTCRKCNMPDCECLGF